MTHVLDHVVHVVADLDGAADAYAAHGFTVTPRADHPFGTSNRLIVLENAYIELVSPTRADLIPDLGFAAEVRDAADRRLPISHVVVRSEDPIADRSVVGERLTEIVEFSRPAPLVGGDEMVASFECLMTGPGDPVGVFLCHQRTPSAIWHAPALRHPNGASSLLRVRADLGDTSRALVERLGVTSAVDAGTPTVWLGGKAMPTVTIAGVSIRPGTG